MVQFGTYKSYISFCSKAKDKIDVFEMRVKSKDQGHVIKSLVPRKSMKALSLTCIVVY